MVLAFGGTLEFELADNGMGGLIGESLQLQALSLTATTESPFNLRIGTTYYWLDNFNLYAPQQWEIFSTQEVLGALNLAAFAVSWDHLHP